jgi:DNA-binding LytR/AlgR family response regulator
MNCIAIDDEPLALDVIKEFSKRTGFINLVDTFTNPLDSIKTIGRFNIDLVFLDIQMPNISGFDFLKSISTPPMVIFTTAFPEHALEGFEANAVDYLVKPFSFERFLKAVNKAFELNQLRKEPTVAEKVKPDFLMVKVEYSTVKIDFNDILYIEGLKDYIKIFCGAKPILTKSTLKNIEEKLSSELFIRVHKSFIVSMKKIKKIENNRIIIGETRVPVGDQYKEQFYRKLNERML